MGDEFFKIELKGFTEARELIREIEDQAPYILARTLSKTASSVKAEEVAEMKKVFDRPTPYTLGGVYAKTATKQDQVARVWLKDKLQAGKGNAAEDYLRPQIFGGERKLKRFEKALNRVGVLPYGYHAIPGDYAERDQYGNMKAGQIVKILSYFQAFGEQGYKANMTQEKIERMRTGYVVVRPGTKRIPGIYELFAARGSIYLRPVMVFLKKVKYKRRYLFYDVGEKQANKVWRGFFDEAWNDAIKKIK